MLLLLWNPCPAPTKKVVCVCERVLLQLVATPKATQRFWRLMKGKISIGGLMRRVLTLSESGAATASCIMRCRK